MLGDIIFNIFETIYNLVLYIAPLVFVILIALYVFACDSEKERGWLLVAAAIILTGLVFANKYGTDLFLMDLKLIIDKIGI